MRVALVKDGEICNVIIIGEGYVPAEGFTVMSEAQAIADSIPFKGRPAPSFQQIYDEALARGFLVEPEAFVLRLGDIDRVQFSQMLALVKEALDLGMIDNTAIQKIADKENVIHEVSTLRFRQIMVQYGLFYKSLWDALVESGN